MSPIPITVFTGYIGAGKTSTILALLPQLPNDYKVVLLKNEFGDIEVDSKLAQQSNLTAVSEILNGCLCCVLVGQMQNALLEIRDKYRPDRIVIECSGSAFPATLAFQIRELERLTNGGLKLDAIVTVIDAENFVGYEDSSPTAKMQASYTDIILINKWEHVSDRDLETVIDHLNTLNELTPKIRCKGRAGVDPVLIFGLESNLFFSVPDEWHGMHHEEVETVSLRSHPKRSTLCLCHVDGHDHTEDDGDNSINKKLEEGDVLDEQVLANALAALSKEVIWRVKGFVRLARGVQILNWAFGRYELTATDVGADIGIVELTVMGERGAMKREIGRLGASLGAVVTFVIASVFTCLNGSVASNHGFDRVIRTPMSITWSPGQTDITPLPQPLPSVKHQRSDTVTEVLSNDDLYHILGIPKSATLDRTTLRRAYLARSRACHPDKFPDNPDATHAFQKVSIAYDVLSKPSSKRLYDARSPSSLYDVFSSRPQEHAEETFGSVVIGVFNDFLDGDLEFIRTLLRAMNDINPSLHLPDDGIDSVLITLQSIRERALSCRICIHVLHNSLTRLLEIQSAIRQLSYLDFIGRFHLTIQLTRITLTLPLALEQALQSRAATVYGHDPNDPIILPKHVTLVIRGVDVFLERMEQAFK